jgi:hypothetical protein
MGGMTSDGSGLASFTCPACGRTSHHPEDIRNGYCGACHAFTGTQAQAKRDYFAEHGEDMVPVKLIDLVCAVARMKQVRDHGIDAEPIVLDRIFTCDLPRLERYLPERAREEMER